MSIKRFRWASVYRHTHSIRPIRSFSLLSFFISNWLTLCHFHSNRLTAFPHFYCFVSHKSLDFIDAIVWKNDLFCVPFVFKTSFFCVCASSSDCLYDLVHVLCVVLQVEWICDKKQTLAVGVNRKVHITLTSRISSGEHNWFPWCLFCVRGRRFAFSHCGLTCQTVKAALKWNNW